jgi:hypothetical protein
MIKNILPIIILFLAFSSKAQDFQISTAVVSNLNGQSLDFAIHADSINGSGNYFYNLVVEIHNTSSVEKFIQVRRTNIEQSGYSFPAGHTMCLGTTCYSGDIIPSASSGKKINANDTIELHVQIEFEPTGYGREHYDIFEKDNTQNSVSFDAYYHSITSNIKNLTSANIVSKAYPNPANNLVKLNYNILDNGFITIHDITGKQIGKAILSKTQNSISLSTDKVNSGMYFYNIYVNNIKIKTDKFVVRH